VGAKFNNPTSVSAEALLFSLRAIFVEKYRKSLKTDRKPWSLAKVERTYSAAKQQRLIIDSVIIS
jgi:hypothetical protein